MTDDPYRSVQNTVENTELTEFEVRLQDVRSLKWSAVQSVAAALDVYDQYDTRSELRHKLAKAGVFRAPIGHNGPEWYTRENDETAVLTNALDIENL